VSEASTTDEGMSITMKDGRIIPLFRYYCLNCGHVCYGFFMRYDFFCNRLCERAYKLGTVKTYQEEIRPNGI
jgi:hypothetical protein